MYYTHYQTNVIPRNFFYKVYSWMMVALGITAATSYTLFANPALFTVFFRNPILVWLTFGAQILIVLALSSGINRLSFSVAAMLFVLYSLLMGVTLSSIFAIYSLAEIGTALIATAGMFGATALYGYMTDADLSSMGSTVIMALFGVIIAGMVNLFFRNPMLDYVLAIASVVIFSLLTAYDMQRLKQLAISLHSHNESLSKITLIGALSLYLNVINLFLAILRLLKKNNQ